METLENLDEILKAKLVTICRGRVDIIDVLDVTNVKKIIDKDKIIILFEALRSISAEIQILLVK